MIYAESEYFSSRRVTIGYAGNAVVRKGVLDEGVKLIGKPVSVDHLLEQM